jgi:hypothetical protein
MRERERDAERLVFRRLDVCVCGIYTVAPLHLCMTWAYLALRFLMYFLFVFFVLFICLFVYLFIGLFAYLFFFCFLFVFCNVLAMMPCSARFVAFVSRMYLFICCPIEFQRDLEQRKWEGYQNPPMSVKELSVAVGGTGGPDERRKGGSRQSKSNLQRSVSHLLG